MAEAGDATPEAIVTPLRRRKPAAGSNSSDPNFSASIADKQNRS
jgi:hypothetical protein